MRIASRSHGIITLMKVIHRFAYGALAGLAGAAAMHAFRIAWEAATGSKAEHGIFGFDEEADVNSSRMLCRLLLNERISRSTAQKVGLSLHYLYGALIGGVYAGAAPRLPGMTCGSGSGFGAALWLAGDEIPISLSGISDPGSKSMASHAAALSAHLLYGVVLEQIRSLQKETD